MGGRASGNLRANQFVYKRAIDADGQGPAIVLNHDGDIGKYNRANRSLHHFIENDLPFIVALPINFYLWPLPTFVLLCIYSFGRMIHQAGYARGGWGSHRCGFFFVLLCSYILVGLMIIAFVKMVF